MSDEDEPDLVALSAWLIVGCLPVEALTLIATSALFAALFDLSPSALATLFTLLSTASSSVHGNPSSSPSALRFPFPSPSLHAHGLASHLDLNLAEMRAGTTGHAPFEPYWRRARSAREARSARRAEEEAKEGGVGREEGARRKGIVRGGGVEGREEVEAMGGAMLGETRWVSVMADCDCRSQSFWSEQC